MYYLLLFHYNNGHENAPQCYVIRTLAVLSMQLLNEELYNSDEYLANKMRVTFEMRAKACNFNFHAPYTSAKTTQKQTAWAERRISEC